MSKIRYDTSKSLVFDLFREFFPIAKYDCLKIKVKRMKTLIFDVNLSQTCDNKLNFRAAAIPTQIRHHNKEFLLYYIQS